MRDKRFALFTQAHVGGARGLTRAFGLLLGLTALSESNASPATPVGPAPAATSATAQLPESRIWMTVRDTRFAITLADTQAARAFAALLPLSIDMPDLNNNEKHAELPTSLPTSTIRPGTIHSGDLMLYGSRTLVAFYATFSSPYSYTRLGRIDNAAELARVFGCDAVRIAFSKQ